jgi:hypothetical protein
MTPVKSEQTWKTTPRWATKNYVNSEPIQPDAQTRR